VPKVTYINADIRNIGNHYLKDFDIVFHLAAHSRIQPSFKHPRETFDVNTVGTMIMLEWAMEHGVKKFIYSGSSSKWHNPAISPYATAKHLGEQLVDMFRHTFGLDTQIARFYNVYGPNEITDGDWAAIIGKWRGLVAKGEPVTIVGNGMQRRTFTYVGDIVDGLIRIAANDQPRTEPWELGANKNYSILEIAQMFWRRFQTPHIFIPARRGEYSETVRMNTDALDELGWQPEGDLERYIAKL
jgi:UDP-glucose 4-epimerase